MAEFVLTNTKIYFDGIDISSKLNSITINNNVDLKDKTTFGSSYRKRLSGLISAEISGQGFYDASSDYQGAISLYNNLGSTNQICTIVAQGSALNNIAYSAQKLESEFSPGFSIGEIASMTFACYSDGALVRQRVLASSGFSTSITATPLNLGFRTPQQALYATLHNVRGTTAAGQTLTIKVQTATSSGFSSSTLSTSLKFTALTTAIHTAQWASTNNSTTHTWYRVAVNSSGSTDGTVNGILTIGLQ